MIMGLLAKLKLKNFFRRAANGVLDSLPVVSTIKSNIENDHTPAKNGNGIGKLDWVRIIVNLGSVVLAFYILYNVVKGNISLADAEKLMNLIK